eukprot:5229533-Pleurochrysis_carterae.AAC.5
MNLGGLLGPRAALPAGRKTSADCRRPSLATSSRATLRGRLAAPPPHLDALVVLAATVTALTDETFEEIYSDKSCRMP